MQGFFANLFSEVNFVASSPLTHDAFPTLSEEAKSMMVQPVMKDEVRPALMRMKSYTALGPDGFQPFFYKKYWNRVADSLWHLVKEAF